MRVIEDFTNTVVASIQQALWKYKIINNTVVYFDYVNFTRASLVRLRLTLKLVTSAGVHQSRISRRGRYEVPVAHEVTNIFVTIECGLLFISACSVTVI